MLMTVMMCQQGSYVGYSPARDQMVDELRQRGSEVIFFYPGHVTDANLKKKVKKIVNTREMSYSSIREMIRKINPDIVVCNTEEDTRICFPLPYLMKNTDFYYYNLEINVYIKKREGESFFSKAEYKIDYLQNKLKEILYVHKCRSIVIQDELRKKILKKYWITHPVTWLIPNSYYSDERRCDVPHKSGLIYSGGVRARMLGSFMEYAEEIKNVEITIAGWDHTKGRFKNNPNIKVITQKLSDEEYTKFISAYDIALVWYSDEDDNIYYVGLSSGKLFKHLSIGQPVIVNEAPGLAEEVRKYKLGVVIKDARELEDAVRTITADYDSYVKNIKRIYRKRYDYKKVSKKFFDSMIDHAKNKK